ncbi:UDP-3-O-(3-hydroxymyristoyl)glucosamine N-acyltransferase [Algicella marina]|uniref:UDP-3-O-(3-hydroxymyristoyl)glucosamine N-acyltransferase n=1 Tax=Algicella marina TaxID=2683284 RepID=A0A6P1T179_9RHOB|nr:UDP-3-O-(3-hydroxymyristoyl)glucosamine N-acyltransferase [Algicella marina]QHQ35206.1 UDP-3-O-(3-hydroxymyristoyl)glucosamine N-acyltransferase [Algicella marina]
MSYSVEELAKALGAEAAGDLGLRVTAPAEPGRAGPEHVAMAMEKKFVGQLADGKALVAIVAEGTDWEALGLRAAIFAPRSRYVMAGIGKLFERPLKIAPGIHPTAVIEDGAEIGAGAAIGPFVHVQSGARIGVRARISSHCSIGENTVIGDDLLLFPGAHIGPHVRIGNRFIGQIGVSVGGDGFSFVSPQPGAVEEARSTGKISEASRTAGFARINSMGGVVIGDDVEMGANSAVDRGTVADTKIGDGTKLDGLVMVGHNVTIGNHCLLCGQSGVAGSSVIGDRVVLAGQAGIADHINIGSDVIITAQTGINANVPSGKIMMGTPAMPMDVSVNVYKATRRLPRLLTKLQEAEKRVSKAGLKE